VDYDTALNAAVRRLRAALGDEAETPRYIETLPRHGYRFIGTLLPPAIAPDAPPAPASRPRRVWLALAAVLLVAVIGAIVWSLNQERAAPHSAARALAVLPFVDLSAQQDQQYFSDGLTEELISRLAEQLPLRVIARTSSFSFQGEKVDIATVARKLGVVTCSKEAYASRATRCGSLRSSSTPRPARTCGRRRTTASSMTS
jgi:hypothetical protein